MRVIKIGQIPACVAGKRLNFSLRAAAREIGVSPSTLHRVERGGGYDARTLVLLCRWLGIKILRMR